MHSLLLRFLSPLFVLGLVSSSYAQSVLIGPSTRNGSFEDGLLAPWTARFSVIQDASFASEGTWYASAQGAFIPVVGGQTLTADQNHGLRFLLSFDARIDTPGLDVVTPSMSARTPAGVPLRATVSTIATPPLSTSAWQRYEYQLQMPANWNNAGIDFVISFSKNEPVNGITHIAYLDNVILQQIPEPSALLLAVCGGAFLAWRARARLK